MDSRPHFIERGLDLATDGLRLLFAFIDHRRRDTCASRDDTIGVATFHDTHSDFFSGLDNHIFQVFGFFTHGISRLRRSIEVLGNFHSCRVGYEFGVRRLAHGQLHLECDRG